MLCARNTDLWMEELYLKKLDLVKIKKRVTHAYKETLKETESKAG